MNCQSCNTRIDYRFLTNCTECERAVESIEHSQLDAVPQFQPAEPVEKHLSWKKLVVNLAYLLVSSLAGMVAGAFIVFFSVGMIYRAVYSGVDEDPSTACARGMAVGMLSFLSGAFVGTVGGSAFAVKRPLFKAQ